MSAPIASKAKIKLRRIHFFHSALFAGRFCVFDITPS